MLKLGMKPVGDVGEVGRLHCIINTAINLSSKSFHGGKGEMEEKLGNVGNAVHCLYM